MIDSKTFVQSWHEQQVVKALKLLKVDGFCVTCYQCPIFTGCSIYVASEIKKQLALTWLYETGVSEETIMEYLL